MPLKWMNAAMLCFAVTALSGVLMRSTAFVDIAVPYTNLLHGHSHLALLGWVYMALFLLLVPLLGGSEMAASRQVRWMFWTTLAVITGMFAAFLAQGYGPVSIAFSTLQLFLSYWLAAALWRRLRGDRSHAAWAARASLICLVLSSAGPWTLAYLAASGQQDSPYYDAAIYFYLHFQYNGWFTLGLAAALLRIIERKSMLLDGRLIRFFLRGYGWALLPAYLHSVLWLDEIGISGRVLAGAAAVLQLAAVAALLLALHRIRIPILRTFAGWSGVLLLWALGILLVKSAMELGLAVPKLSDWIYNSRSIVVGYLHLVLLGFVSLMALSLLSVQGWLSLERGGAKAACTILMAGIIVTEAVLFLQGLYDGLGWGYVPRMEGMLFGASTALAAGVIGLWLLGRVRA